LTLTQVIPIKKMDDFHLRSNNLNLNKRKVGHRRRRAPVHCYLRNGWGGHWLLGTHGALAGMASALMGEGSLSSLCAPGPRSCHNSLPAQLPVFSLSGMMEKAQQDTGLDWALLRPPASCPSRVTTGPSPPGHARPPSRHSPTSKPGSLVPYCL